MAFAKTNEERQFCVLVAEDDLFQRLALLDFMSICKFNTVEAENGRIALEEMRKPENDFDIILLDLMMPEMDGYAVLAAMKDDPKLSEIPVVVMSAQDSQDSVSQCLRKQRFSNLQSDCLATGLTFEFLSRAGSNGLPCQANQDVRVPSAHGQDEASISAISVSLAPARETHRSCKV